jgi:hypothetical protein
METLGNQKLRKVAKQFTCFNCDYFTTRKSSYDKHILTNKHTDILMETKGCEKLQKVANKNNCSCEICNKEFVNRSGLWKHKNKETSCSQIKYNLDKLDNTILVCDKEPTDNEPTDNEPTDKELIMMLIKQNSNLNKEQTDIKQIIMELVKNGINNTNNNTINNNSHNKAFNLNFFLNDTCKNAMNINEFLDSIQLELNDLMELGELGYVASMSKIIAKNLNALDETIRPIHCTDTKREIFYIKDDNKWEKEDVEMKKLRKLILKLSLKTYKLLPQYREKFPDYNSSTSTHSDEHCIIIMEAMTCDKLKDEKIIRNISKVTTISK